MYTRLPGFFWKPGKPTYFVNWSECMLFCELCQAESLQQVSNSVVTNDNQLPPRFRSAQMRRSWRIVKFIAKYEKVLKSRNLLVFVLAILLKFLIPLFACKCQKDLFYFYLECIYRSFFPANNLQ